MSTTDEQRRGGYVYVMTNPAMPGLVKIGRTRRLPSDRARELSSTGVPEPFEVVAFQWFEDDLIAERTMQSLFTPHRKAPNREFFSITIEQAQEAIIKLSEGHLTEKLSAVGADTSPPRARPDRRPVSGDKTKMAILGYSYWTRFNEMRIEKGLAPRFDGAGYRFFVVHRLVSPSVATHGRNIHYEGRIRLNTLQVSMRLILKTIGKDKTDNVKILFDVIAEDRTKIEYEIGQPLIWTRDKGSKESHIALERDDLDPRDVNMWEEQHAWLSDTVSKFEAVLRPRVARLKIHSK